MHSPFIINCQLLLCQHVKVKIEQFIIPGRTLSAGQGNQDRSFEVPLQKRKRQKREMQGGEWPECWLRCCTALRSLRVPCVVFQQRNPSTPVARLALRRGLSFGALFMSREGARRINVCFAVIYCGIYFAHDADTYHMRKVTGLLKCGVH